jgi:hypothetical protein
MAKPINARRTSALTTSRCMGERYDSSAVSARAAISMKVPRPPASIRYRASAGAAPIASRDVDRPFNRFRFNVRKNGLFQNVSW